MASEKKNQLKVLFVGNDFISADSLAINLGRELASQLKDVDFFFVKDSFELVNYLNSGSELIIVDVVNGIDKTKTLSVDDLSMGKIMNSHDFDAGFFLKLLGRKEKIKIIGIPYGCDPQSAKKSVLELLESVL